MKAKLIIPRIGLLGILFFTSCRTEPVMPSETVSFSKQVMPIIASNCTQSGCHGVVNHKEGTLLNYDEVIKFGEVEAGYPHTSKLYEAITSTSKEERMPQSPYSALSETQLSIIFVWIKQGAKNN